MVTLLTEAEISTGSWQLFDVLAFTDGKTPEKMNEEERVAFVGRQVVRYQNENEQNAREFALGPVPQVIPSVVEHLGPITMVGLFERVDPS